MIYCGKAEFGQIFRSFSLNTGAIRLKRSKNLTQIGFPSLRSVKSDRLLECVVVKKRVAVGGRGKRGGVRTLLAYKSGDKAFLCMGSPRMHVRMLVRMN